MILNCIFSALIPFSTELWFLYICGIIVGWCSGAWHNVLYVWLIEIWQHKSAPVLQLMQFMNGIGNILGPILVKPYLIGERDDQSNGSDFSSFSNQLIIKEIDKKANLKPPFIIGASIQMICKYIYITKDVLSVYVSLLLIQCNVGIVQYVWTELRLFLQSPAYSLWIIRAHAHSTYVVLNFCQTPSPSLSAHIAI